MKTLRRFLRTIGWIAVGVVAVYLLAAAALGRPELLALVFGPVERQNVDFTTLARRETPNDFLVCPAEVCAAPADLEAPVIDESVDNLRVRFLELVAARPDLRLISSDPVRDQYDIVEHSLVFAFPDTMTVRLFERRDGTSTVAVYSRSHYGVDDLGVNESRVRAWLVDLAGGPN